MDPLREHQHACSIVAEAESKLLDPRRAPPHLVVRKCDEGTHRISRNNGGAGQAVSTLKLNGTEAARASAPAISALAIHFMLLAMESVES